jgi:DNA-binding GntR family transcriptional regulator
MREPREARFAGRLSRDEGAAESRQLATERIHELLRHDILRARLQPGQTILEPELAARFSVSKTPVREALRLLVQEGWVVVLPRKGYLIRPLGLDDIREVFHLREMLEPGFAAEAAWRSGGRRDDGIRRAVEALRSASTDVDQALASAAAFHIRIAELSGNVRGVKIVANLVDEVTRLHYLMPSLEAHIESSEELDAHERIAEAIEVGDPQVASCAIISARPIEPWSRCSGFHVHSCARVEAAARSALDSLHRADIFLRFSSGRLE